MRLLVFVRGEHAPYGGRRQLQGLRPGDTLGNKGATAFRIHGRRLLRQLPPRGLPGPEQRLFADRRRACWGMRASTSCTSSHRLLVGDLNYRVDGPQDVALDLLGSRGPRPRRPRARLAQLRAADQLDLERAAGRAFPGRRRPRVPADRPATPGSPARRRTARGSGGGKGRVPSWCDRVLWKSLPGARRQAPLTTPPPTR